MSTVPLDGMHRITLVSKCLKQPLLPESQHMTATDKLRIASCSTKPLVTAGAYRYLPPRNTGARFSRKALTPSRASASFSS